MRNKDETKFITSQTRSDKSNLYKFIEKASEDDALRAASAYYQSGYFKSQSQPIPENINEQIGHGLIVLAGQPVPCKSSTRGTVWPKNGKKGKYTDNEGVKLAIEAALLAAGPIALEIENVKNNVKKDFFQKNQNQDKILIKI
jgi:hypothetical protein